MQPAWPAGDTIPAWHTKTAKDRLISDHQRSQIVACVQSHINQFLRYMDVEVNSRNIEEVLRDHNVLMQFAEYLTDNRILTCKVYYWKVPDRRGEYTDFATAQKYIAIGLDIKEDELYTLQSLKT
jgi:hypothetical protein